MSAIQSISITSAPSFASVSPQGPQSLQPFANLNLTAAQRTSLRSIFSDAKQNGTSPSAVQQQVDGVLSPAQQQTLQSDLKAGGFGRHHHHQSADGTSTASSPAPSSTAASSAATSTSSIALALVSSAQNQVAAAQSTLNNTLQKTLTGTQTASAAATANADSSEKSSASPDAQAESAG